MSVITVAHSDPDEGEEFIEYKVGHGRPRRIPIEVARAIASFMATQCPAEEGVALPRLEDVFAAGVPHAIDPEGCGCTECLTGEYVPLDKATGKHFQRVLARTIFNHTPMEEGELVQFAQTRLTHT
jgi:hypothetical protein